jgi:hypothetical protein
MNGGPCSPNCRVSYPNGFDERRRREQIAALRMELTRRAPTVYEASHVDHVIALGKSGALEGGPNPLPTLRGGALPPGRTASRGAR